MQSVSNLIQSTPRILGTRNKNILGPRKTQTQTNVIAEKLAAKFGNTKYLPLFYKAAWQLDEQTLERLADTALELATGNPCAYFAVLVRQEAAQ